MIVSLVYQVITLICGFILPRFFLRYYGSAVNGLVSSITQFLGFISLAECGVGAVVQSALYRPLAMKDEDQVSRIICSSEQFFRRIAIILCFYTVVLMVAYPVITLDKFDFVYTLGLIFIISISSFAQYYFSMSYRLLLNADQMGFIQLGLQAITTLLNTVFCVIFMKLGMGVHFVKLMTAAIFLIQPIVLNAYVKNHYNLDKKIKLEGEAIKQKWNGLAQHIATVVLGNTDTVVLTLFSTLENVSIYAVYHLVVNGVKQILISLTTGMQAMLGNMYAKKETEILDKTFGWLEWLIHFVVIFAFTCTAVLILPFVSVYTADVTDANYIVPDFAMLISAAQASYCLRLPYNMMVLAAGHYKQTQWSAIIEAGINIVVSVVLVKSLGLVGVAIGTLAAMFYRTTYLAWYLSKEILCRKMGFYFKHLTVDIACVLVTILLTKNVSLSATNYTTWVVMAIKVALLTLLPVVVLNGVFYPVYVKEVIQIVGCYGKGIERRIVYMINRMRNRFGGVCRTSSILYIFELYLWSRAMGRQVSVCLLR